MVLCFDGTNGVNTPILKSSWSSINTQDSSLRNKLNSLVPLRAEYIAPWCEKLRTSFRGSRVCPWERNPPTRTWEFAKLRKSLICVKRNPHFSNCPYLSIFVHFVHFWPLSRFGSLPTSHVHLPVNPFCKILVIMEPSRCTQSPSCDFYWSNFGTVQPPLHSVTSPWHGSLPQHVLIIKKKKPDVHFGRFKLPVAFLFYFQLVFAAWWLCASKRFSIGP